MSSDNVTSGDNQQETASPSIELEPQWVVGFVDGEGCFSVSIHRNPLVRRTPGWQVKPVFQVSQHQRHRAVLEALQAFFSCGRVRGKGAESRVDVFAVDRMIDLEAHVIPFFELHPLVVKHHDFVAFRTIVRAMRAKEHLTADGFERVVRLAYGMNAAGKQRSRTLEEVLAGSSETARQAPPAVSVGKIQSDPHGDMRSQTEMIWPPFQWERE